MTLRQAIERLDARLHNTYTNAEKVSWLSAADAIVKIQVLDTHEQEEVKMFNGYDGNDLEQELIVPAPFDEMYLYWMESQIHYHNDEHDRYNTSIIQYNKFFNDFANWFTRNNMPINKGARFIF